MKIEIVDYGSCPYNREREAHGPSDSDYWNECSKTETKMMKPRIIKWTDTYNTKFPKWCPLK